jgi:hypothetical protein
MFGIPVDVVRLDIHRLRFGLVEHHPENRTTDLLELLQ